MKKIIYLVTVLLISTISLEAQVNDTLSKSCFDSIPGVIIKTDTIIEKDDTSLYSEEEYYGGPYAPPSPSQSKWKNVFFVHGLGGGETTWWQQRDYVYHNYKAETPAIEYIQETNISNCANVLHNDFSGYNQTMIGKNNIYNQDYKRDESIIIAHSMGGVVSRQMDKDIEDLGVSREFGALATFGSPHQGAVIIKSLDDGNVEKLTSDLCHVFLDVALEQLDEDIDLELDGFFGFLINGKLKRLERHMFFRLDTTLNRYVCSDVFGENGIGFNAFRSSIAPPVGIDLHPDPDIGITGELDKHSVQIPNVAFYGIETGSTEADDDGYMALREIYSLENNINDEPIFGADYDEGYIQKYEDLKSYLQSQAEYYKDTPPHSYNYKNWLCWYPIWTCDNDQECIDLRGVPKIIWTTKTVQFMKCVIPNRISEKYTNAYNAVSHFDKEYSILFGQYESKWIQTGTEEETHCVVYNGEGEIIDEYGKACEDMGFDVLEDPEAESSENITVEVPIMENTGIYYPGDGVVPAYSQKYFNGVKNTVKMFDTNHQQMRNSSETEKAFKNLFDNNKYGNEFHLEGR